jgi:hypothetical protein
MHIVDRRHLVWCGKRVLTSWKKKDNKNRLGEQRSRRGCAGCRSSELQARFLTMSGPSERPFHSDLYHLGVRQHPLRLALSFTPEPHAGVNADDARAQCGKSKRWDLCGGWPEGPFLPRQGPLRGRAAPSSIHSLFKIPLCSSRSAEGGIHRTIDSTAIKAAAMRSSVGLGRGARAEGRCRGAT